MIKENMFALGADIGGTHITAALVNVIQKELILPGLTRSMVPPDSNVDVLIREWAGCISKARGDKPVSKICIAMPGPFMYEEGICLIKDQGKYPGLYGVNIKERLARALQIESVDIYLYNDAACFLQGEVFSGNATGFQHVIGVTLGTGLGTAIYKNNFTTSADLWNLPFRDSIAEDYISSRWFINRYRQLTGGSIGGVKELVSLSTKEPGVVDIFDEFGNNLGEFLNLFISREKPEAIVIGGNISNAFSLFQKSMFKTIHSVNPGVQIYQVSQAEHAALLGAVSCWYNSRHISATDNIS